MRSVMPVTMKNAPVASTELTRYNSAGAVMTSASRPTAASNVPEETMTANAINLASCCEASMPMMPNTIVAIPATNNHSLPNGPCTPDSLSNEPTRMIAYTPTLVSNANTPATGAAAAVYALGSQKFNGHAAALMRNARPRIVAPMSNSPRSSGNSAATRGPRSAMFNVPATPYTSATPIKNMSDDTRLTTR